MTTNDTTEIRDALFDAARTMEELIVYQEGKLPARMFAIQKAEGYTEARKAVLNEARSTLRRVKTIMLRSGVIKSVVNPPEAEPQQGYFERTAERGNDMPVYRTDDQERLGLSTKRSFYAFVASLSVLFALGFFHRSVHSVIAGAIVVLAWALCAYWKTVGVK